MDEGKQPMATSGQRNFLRKLGFEPWPKMTRDDASNLLNALQAGDAVVDGHWTGPPATERQLAFMADLRIPIPEGCLKGQASWLLERDQKLK